MNFARLTLEDSPKNLRKKHIFTSCPYRATNKNKKCKFWVYCPYIDAHQVKQFLKNFFLIQM